MKNGGYFHVFLMFFGVFTVYQRASLGHQTKESTNTACLDRDGPKPTETFRYPMSQVSEHGYSELTPIFFFFFK